MCACGIHNLCIHKYNRNALYASCSQSVWVQCCRVCVVRILAFALHYSWHCFGIGLELCIELKPTAESNWSNAWTQQFHYPFSPHACISCICIAYCLLFYIFIYLFGCLLMFFLMFCGLLMQIQFARTRLNAIRKAMGKSILSQIWYGSLWLWYWVRAERFTQNSRHYSKRDMCDKFVRSINEVSLCSRISHIQNHFSVHRLVLANASGFCIRIEMLFRVFVNSIETFASKRDKNPHKCTHSF